MTNHSRNSYNFKQAERAWVTMKQTIRLTLLQFLMLGIIVTLVPGLAAAHVLRQDHGVAAELHIPPDDHPIAGQPTRLEVSFGDSQDVFKLTDCTCRLQVFASGKTIQSRILEPAQPDSTLDSTTTVQFPSIATYQVVITGNSKTGRFSNFTLDYPVRVAASTTSPSPASSTADKILLIGTGVLVVTVLVAAGVRRRPLAKISR